MIEKMSFIDGKLKCIVKLIDFGFAKNSENDLSARKLKKNSSCGTGIYKDPLITIGVPANDVFSFGMLV